MCHGGSWALNFLRAGRLSGCLAGLGKVVVVQVTASLSSLEGGRCSSTGVVGYGLFALASGMAAIDWRRRERSYRHVFAPLYLARWCYCSERSS